MDRQALPSENEIFAWIEKVFSWGIRRPGYEADRRTEEFVLHKFRELGLENVRAEPVELPFWESESAWLKVVGPDESFEVPCFPLPHTAPVDRVELPLMMLESDANCAGHAVLAPHSLMRVPPTMVLNNNSVPGHVSDNLVMGLNTGGLLVDSGGTLENSEQVLPFSPLVQLVMEPAIKAGASAFIGGLEDYPGDSYQYYVPYDAKERPIPGVWIRGSDSKRIRDLLGIGSVTVTLEVKSKRDIGTSYNIVGELPGADDEWLLIGSHHDGPWASAVEDASGVALVLAQASYWAKQPDEARPHRMVFLLNAGHMAGGAGCETFIEQHRQHLDKIVLSVHLEHAANECREEDGVVVPTGLPEARWFFTTQNSHLKQFVQAALEAEKLDRSMIIRPDVFGDRPTTDGGAFHLEGVPLVNYLTAPFYLFDAMDTLDKIHRPSFMPVTRATIRIIEDTRGVSASAMRT